MNLHKLYHHLDADARRVLHAAADQAVRDRRIAITVEFFLLLLLRDRHSGASLAQSLASAGADVPALETALSSAAAAEDRATSEALPSFSGSLAELLREAWRLAFDEYGETSVTPPRFFETLVRRGDLWPVIVRRLPALAAMDLGRLSQLGVARSASAGAAVASGVIAPGSASGDFPELSRYGRDLRASSAAGEIDPVIGFRAPMRAIASVLLRRRQNCAVVVGEAGVGKTACALGFVDALANGVDPIPEVLHSTPVWSLDLSALRAGASVRGALEERLQQIIAEVRDTGMILVVDDLHLLLGDQGQGADALRSVVSSGAIRVLATCGWREWRRFIEPDPGLARRLASVRIQEPDDVRSAEILRGAAPALSAHHSVSISDDVLDSAISLSRRYIVGRRLPDKALVVLDSACARARMDALSAPSAPESSPDDAAAASAGGDVPEHGVDVMLGAGGDADPVSVASSGLDSDVSAPEASGEGTASFPVAVSEDDVGAVVSDLTGVPIGLMLTDASVSASRLESLLSERVVGQDDALARCASQARAYLAGLSDRRRPVGALMFAGPSGVGKTETAHALADALFGGRILSINMSEYQEAHTVSGLKGAPAGYVGYGEGGVLTEGVRRMPYCVVLLDEIEKAHTDVIEMLYQVLDRGWMEDAEGIEADFSNALIVLTTNVGDQVIQQAQTAEEPPEEEVFDKQLRAAMARSFQPAFIGRLQIVPYWMLGDESLVSIASMRLDRLAEAYRASHRSSLVFGDDVRAWLAERVRTTPQGARFLDGLIAASIRPAVADYVLGHLGAGRPPGDAQVLHTPDGRFVCEAVS